MPLTAKIPPQVASKYITIEDIKIHYLEAGEKSDEVVFMIHGFPTCAYLWRNIMPLIAEKKRVIAIDLPAYGKSEKPLNVSYSLNFFDKILSGFFTELQVKKVDLVVHDLGGPIGMLWAVRHQEMLNSIAFLNTLIYPNFSWAVIAFTLALKTPFLQKWVASPNGIKKGLRWGVMNKNRISGELLENYQSPFREKSNQLALIKSATNISLKGFKEIEAKLPNLKIPTRCIYGRNDVILPNVAKTMARIKQDLPQTEITALENCGHFLQEDEPEKIAERLGVFYDKK